MSIFPLKPTHKPVRDYFAALAQFNRLGHTTEGNTRSAFADLLKKCCPPYHWHLVEEFHFKGTNKQPLWADGALIDDLTLQHGIWEAKDTDDDLKAEIKKKVAAGYPLTNILFQSPNHAVLYQDGRITFDDSITAPEKLIELLECFFEHRQAHETDWEEAVLKFGEKIPDLAKAVNRILEDEDKRNERFREAFASFVELCRQSINPDLPEDAVRKMLVQHLLTVRIFTRVFQNEDFVRKNVIAAEIEKVIDTITARYFSRSEFLRPLDPFYIAIEEAAKSQQSYTEKQTFLNAVYEKFFQRFDKKQADTHGIVYTPQPLVDFMVRSVEEILGQEFEKSLSDSGVQILDPFTGTGNFITRIMQQIKRSALPHKYAKELHCNEIMLLPYYIASMNIEHAYHERVGQYEPFEGICLVDTFELSEFGQQSFAFSDSNTERVRRQKRQPIFVVIGNPPYNMGQESEDDQNKNRKYKHWDNRIKDTYTKASKATLKNKLSDPYVKAFRWASDRIRNGGVIAYVTNNSYIDQIAFDGMRHHLARDFSKLYLLDLGGNIRKNPKLSGTTHNVFGIQVGVCISLLVKHTGAANRVGEIYYAKTPTNWRRGQKYLQLQTWQHHGGVDWKRISPDDNCTWLNEDESADFADQLPLGVKAEKGSRDVESIFQLFSLGLATNRDAWAYNFDADEIARNLEKTVVAFAEEQARYKRLSPEARKKFKPRVNETKIKWTDRLVEALGDEHLSIDRAKIRPCTYRPFTHMYVYFDHLLNQRRYQQHHIFPEKSEPGSNIAIWIKTGSEVPFWALATQTVPDLLPQGGSQTFPYYVFDEDGTNRRENITDWALNKFRTHYSDQSITKWNIFHATYAIFHHPEYRARYAANLKRELPRIPFPPDFHGFAAAGKRLTELHIKYEKQPEYPLQQIEDDKAEVTFRVERMRINTKDRSELRYNDFLTLRGIPLAAYDYRLGNRSAVEWIVDQYRVSTDARSGIVNDPNREDDPRYILRLIGQVITVSIKTQQIINGLPSLGVGDSPSTEFDSSEAADTAPLPV